jgi:hypothetical protein
MFSYLDMETTKIPARLVIVRIESYEGRDTFMRCGDESQDYLFAIVSIHPDGAAEIIDSSYRTLDEAVEAWPEAAPRRLADNL